LRHQSGRRPCLRLFHLLHTPSKVRFSPHACCDIWYGDRTV
jgi:hypothetical protein